MVERGGKLGFAALCFDACAGDSELALEPALGMVRRVAAGELAVPMVTAAARLAGELQAVELEPVA